MRASARWPLWCIYIGLMGMAAVIPTNYLPIRLMLTFAGGFVFALLAVQPVPER